MFALDMHYEIQNMQLYIAYITVLFLIKNTVK